MIKKLLRLIPYVRKLEADNARRHHQLGELVAGKTTLHDIAIRNGGFNLEVSGEFVRVMATHYATILKEPGAENYVEMHFCDQPIVDSADPEHLPRRICVTIRWEDKQTPHELRQQAEKLLVHAYIHSNYTHCGFMQMTTAKKQRFVSILRDHDMADCAKSLEQFIAP